MVAESPATPPTVVRESAVAAFGVAMTSGLREVLQVALAGNASDSDTAARSKRFLGTFLAVYAPRPEGTSAPVTPFEKTALSPNEVSAALEDISAGMRGKNAADLRASFSLPTPTAAQQEAARARTIFTPREEPIAIAMIGTGFKIAQMAREAGKVLAPEVVFPGEHGPRMREELAKLGHLSGTVEEQTALMSGVRAKLSKGLQTSFTANQRAPRELRQKLAQQ